MGYGPNSDHYGDGVQPVDLIESMGLGFHAGNAIKYIARAGRKGGNAEYNDLLKAEWYLQRMIARAKPSNQPVAQPREAAGPECDCPAERPAALALGGCPQRAERP